MSPFVCKHFLVVYCATSLLLRHLQNMSMSCVFFLAKIANHDIVASSLYIVTALYRHSSPGFLFRNQFFRCLSAAVIVDHHNSVTFPPAFCWILPNVIITPKCAFKRPVYIPSVSQLFLCSINVKDKAKSIPTFPYCLAVSHPL